MVMIADGRVSLAASEGKLPASSRTQLQTRPTWPFPLPELPMEELYCREATGPKPSCSTCACLMGPPGGFPYCLPCWLPPRQIASKRSGAPPTAP